MDENWKKVFSNTNRLRIDIVKSVLEEHDIKAFVLDKIDSSYNDFGEVEIYVETSNAVSALKIIEDAIHFE